jgi:O-antigen ligase
VLTASATTDTTTEHSLIAAEAEAVAVCGDDTELPTARLPFGLSGFDVVASVLTLGLCVAYGTMFLVPSWTPRMMFVVAAAPIGTALVVRQAAQRDRIAITSLALLLWGIGVSLVAANPVGSIVGRVGIEESGLVLAAAVGALALGRELSDRGRVAVTWAALLGIALSCIVGLLQYLVQTDSGTLSLYAGRSSGLTSNPVYFGACAAGASGIVIARSSAQRFAPADLAMAILFGTAISLSASRVALGASILLAAYHCAVRRTRPTLLASGALLCGVGVGTLLTYTVGEGLNSVNRLADGGASRTKVWRYGIDAVLERPIQGWGFGEFRTAVQGRVTVDHARTLGDGMQNDLFDAHNAVIETAVALGVVGLLLAAVLVALICRHARGPLAVGVAALSLSWMLQPMGLATFPLALLLVGSALPMARRSGDHDGAAPTSARFVLLVVPGVVAALVIGAIDISAEGRLTGADSSGLAAIVDALPDDAVLANIVGQSYELDAADGDEAAAWQALRWRERSTESQPDRTRWWVARSLLEARLGDFEAALRSVDRALVLEPNSWSAVELKVALLEASGESDEVLELMPQACDLGVPSCID